MQLLARGRYASEADHCIHTHSVVALIPDQYTASASAMATTPVETLSSSAVVRGSYGLSVANGNIVWGKYSKDQPNEHWWSPLGIIARPVSLNESILSSARATASNAAACNFWWSVKRRLRWRDTSSWQCAWCFVIYVCWGISHNGYCRRGARSPNIRGAGFGQGFGRHYFLTLD